MENGKLWIRLIRHQKIVKDLTVPCRVDAWQSALQDGCHTLDLSKPLIIGRHERDFDEYRQARFLPSDFMDHFPYDRMEIEYFEEGARPKGSDDPRNA